MASSPRTCDSSNDQEVESGLRALLQDCAELRTAALGNMVELDMAHDRYGAVCSCRNVHEDSIAVAANIASRRSPVHSLAKLVHCPTAICIGA